MRANWRKTPNATDFKWRKNQLQEFIRGFVEMRREFEEAIFEDLGRSANASAQEYQMTKVAAEHDLYHLKTYMKDIHEEAELLFAPAKVMTKYEPLGICGVFSAWNYPIMTAFKPLIQCITSGNAVILKPSEISAACSAVIKKFCDRYLDTNFIRCVEGGIDAAQKLNI